MTDRTFSPAAQQVFWEFNRAASGKPDDWHYLPAIAAALRAAADQVVPEHRENYPNTLDERHRKMSVFDIRNRILAIAAELEGRLE
jgi:hypothetical protein